MIGRTVSHYKILEKIGEGGMGVVYKAEDTRLKRTVALKFLPSNVLGTGKQRERFVHEAQAAAALDHPNICTIHEIDTVDDHTFIAMGYVEGESLESKIEKGPLELEDCIRYATETCEALGEAHARKIIHRDIKPSNIMVSDKGRVILMDFGLARLPGRTQLTEEGTTVGTVHYMSPEQARGEDVDHRTDIWSAGVVLYQMISGRLPFRGDHATAVLYSIMNEDPDPLTALRTDVPVELEQLVDKMLAKDPGERYQNVAQIVADSNKLRRGLGTRRGATPARTAADKPGKRRITKFGVPSLLVFLLVAGFFLVRPFLFDETVVSAPKAVAVISFENQTGDMQYDYLRKVIPNLLITKLEQSKYLTVVSWERMRDLLRQSGRGDQELIDRDAGFEVCRLDGIDTIVLGSFAMAGDVFVTDVKVLDVHSKELLKSASAKGDGVGSILSNQIDELGREISLGIGLSERSIAASGQPVADVTTRSMDAYHYFLKGREEYHDRYPAGARRSLEKAVELDSTFAVAWLYLGRAYRSLGNYNSGNQAFSKARQLAVSAPAKDSLYIEAVYANVIERDDVKYLQSLRELIQRFPKEKFAREMMGTYYYYQNDFDRAAESYETALSLDPEFADALNGMAYVHAAMEDYPTAIEYLERCANASPGDTNPIDSMAEMYFRLGRLDKAVELYEKTLDIRPDLGTEERIAYISALEEDYTGAIEWCERYTDAAPSPGLAGSGRVLQSFYRLMSCRDNEAIGVIEPAREVFERLGRTVSKAGTWWFEGWARYHLEEYERARECYERMISLLEKDNRFVSFLEVRVAFALGLVDVKEGRMDAAKERLAEIEAALPDIAESDPPRLPMTKDHSLLLEGEILLAEGRVGDAIEVCKKRPELGIPSMGSVDMFFYNLPAERDVLARAYIAEGAVDEAIAEYERLVTFDPSSRNRRLIYPLFHYRLGLLYEQKGSREKAAGQYEKFLDITGGAGADRPEAADASRRLSLLRQ
jgi:tetratricopeptide (TPR) repeat protein/TolB-like protein